jgi:hypothetical protein
VRHHGEHVVARARCLVGFFERALRRGLGAADPDRESDPQRQPARRKVALGKKIGDPGVDRGLQQLLAVLTDLAGDEDDRRQIAGLAQPSGQLGAGDVGQRVIE